MALDWVLISSIKNVRETAINNLLKSITKHRNSHNNPILAIPDTFSLKESMNDSNWYRFYHFCSRAFLSNAKGNIGNKFIFFRPVLFVVNDDAVRIEKIVYIFLIRLSFLFYLFCTGHSRQFFPKLFEPLFLLLFHFWGNCIPSSFLLLLNII